MALFTCTVLYTLLFTTLFTYTERWHDIDRWGVTILLDYSHRRINDVALTDDGHWSMMWHWLMKCHDPVGLKFLCTVDWWRGSISVDQKSRVWYMHYIGLFSTKSRHCSSRVKPCYYSNRVVKPRTVDWWRGAILRVQIILIRWPWFTQCIYKRGSSPPNLISLNPFFGSIVCNSFSILYVF